MGANHYLWFRSAFFLGWIVCCVRFLVVQVTGSSWSWAPTSASPVTVWLSTVLLVWWLIGLSASSTGQLHSNPPHAHFLVNTDLFGIVFFVEEVFVCAIPFLLSVALWYMPPIDAVLWLMGPNGTQLISHVIGVADESEFRDDVREAFVSWSFSFSFLFLERVAVLARHLLFMVLAQNSLALIFVWHTFLVSLQFVYPSDSTEMLSEEVLNWMEQGLMWFNVTTADNPKGYLNGSIPPLERNKCAQPSYVSHTMRTLH